MFGFRVLRKSWILFLILFVSTVYFLVATLSKSSDLILLEKYESRQTLRRPFQWQPQLSDEVEVNDTVKIKCRNSVQGSKYIVDDKGYICFRRHVNANGCCNSKKSSSVRYNCDGCHNNKCCVIYEHCVSCCVHPDKRPLLGKVLQESQGAKNEPYNKLYLLVVDQFELCLAKCRTSSQSVQHENSYRDPKAKHCFGESPPDLQSSSV